MIKIEQWYQKGKAFLKLRRYDKAVESFDLVLRTDPEHSDAWYNRGLALSALKRHNDALRSYDNALRINPQDYIAWNNRGVSLGKLGQYKEAFKAYDKAISLYPQYAKAWNNKGVAYGKLEMHEQAFLAYDRALQIDGEYSIAWNNRGVTLTKLKRYEEAYDAYEKALEFNPNYKFAQNNLAEVLEVIRSQKRAIGDTPLHQKTRTPSAPAAAAAATPPPPAEGEIGTEIFQSNTPINNPSPPFAAATAQDPATPPPSATPTRSPAAETQAISVVYWNGDELPIEAGTGELPKGFKTSPGYKQFSRSRHKPGYFSYAPFYNIPHPGRFRAHWLMTFGNKGNPSDMAFTVDIFDHDSRQQLWTNVIRVEDLMRPSGGFSIHSGWVDIPVGHKLESRILVGGGCDLRLYFVRWEIDPNPNPE